jgi:hypothetical protein
MQTRQEILEQLMVSKTKRTTIRLKITHEHEPFVADVDDILTEKEVVKLKPVDTEHAFLRRSSYYVDEIEHVEKVGFLSTFTIYKDFFLGRFKSN